AVVVYSIYTPNPKKQKTVAESTETSVAITSLTETTSETTSIETLSTPSETTATETTQTTNEDINKNLPTLKLVVYEGPVIIEDSSICYYRVVAIVTGDPYPAIKFSKDDSNGAWGRNKTQVNLKNGESYDLVVTATNSAGKITRSIELTWIQ
ncbi:MAG: hypothetical protein ACYCXK_01310, partial [Candidatus Humimicrobiaceae bacterium]